MNTTIAFDELVRTGDELRNKVFSDKNEKGTYDIVISADETGLWGMRFFYKVNVDIVKKINNSIVIVKCGDRYQDFIYDEKSHSFIGLSKTFGEGDGQFRNPMTIGDYWRMNGLGDKNVPKHIRKEYPFTTINVICASRSEKYNILL